MPQSPARRPEPVLMLASALLTLGSLLGFAAAAAALVDHHPASLAAPAAFAAFIAGVGIAESSTRKELRAWCRSAAGEVLARWECDEASWRWSVGHRARDTALRIVLVAVLTGIVVGFVATAGAGPVEWTAAVGLGASFCGIVLGVGGFLHARQARAHLRDPRREVLFGPSLLLLGDEVIQLNEEPRLPRLRRAVWLLSCATAWATAPGGGLVLRLTVMTAQRSAARLEVVELAVPSARTGDVSALVATYAALAARNRAVRHVAALVASLQPARRAQLGDHAP